MDKTRRILREEFRHVPGLTALYLQAENDVCKLCALVDGKDAAGLAFEAFRNAADRLAIETPNRVVFVWYGVLDHRLDDAEELSC